MTRISETIARLGKLRAAGLAAAECQAPGRLTELRRFGSNPGKLRAWSFVPAGLGAGAPLVVVLHGCTQNAAGYDRGAGWSELSERHGFALLFPEQQRSGNANLCFNWFAPAHNRREGGEALSIAQAIGTMKAAHGIDDRRVFVTGLSAGGAMAMVMLATYPELFAGGAIIAGLPYGCAASVPEAFDRMRGSGLPSSTELESLVLRASKHRRSWPLLSVWHGSADATVNPSNADAIVDQWRSLHGLGASPTRIEAVDGYPRQVWCGSDGREIIESYSITGMGHGTPLARGSGGVAGSYMLDAGISSTQRIARFWGIAAEAPRRAAPPATSALPVVQVVPSEPGPSARPLGTPQEREPQAATDGVTRIIEDALRTAGLMRR
jgi:poly(hydroxyalkanoate) depolymerase family esterase